MPPNTEGALIGLSQVSKRPGNCEINHTKLGATRRSSIRLCRTIPL